MSTMAAKIDIIAKELPPLGIRVYKSGRVERKIGTDFAPPSLDPATGVESRDIIINPVKNISARIYLPKNPQNKLPLIVYFHGGGFCIESAFVPLYQPFCNSFAASANAIIVSVNYRLAPENPIPVPYEDSWEAVNWIVSQSGNDKWLSEYADFNQVYFAGDSAGANIVHNMAIKAGLEGLPGSTLLGIVLIQPYFWGKDEIEGETSDPRARWLLENIWLFACSDSSGSGLNNPLINPNIDPKYSVLGCERVLVCVAEKDVLRERGRDYYKKLRGSKWKGEAEIFESKGVDHVFQLFYPDSDNTKELVKRVASYLNRKKM